MHNDFTAVSSNITFLNFTEPKPDEGLKTGTIIGIAVGCLILVCFGIGIGIYFIRKKPVGANSNSEQHEVNSLMPNQRPGPSQ
jgi:hypothetical protein